MQEKIIAEIRKEQEYLQNSLGKENAEITFFEDFLQRINFSDINTYSNVSIEELIMAYVRSKDSNFSLEEIQEIAVDIVPIFEKCTSEEVHSLLQLIDDFALADNYEEIMERLYSESKVEDLEYFIIDNREIEGQEYVLPAARIMEKEENEKLIDFIEIFHESPDAWGYALLLVSTFYQIKETKKILEENNRGRYLLLPRAPKETLEENFDVSAIRSIVRAIPRHLNKLEKAQEEAKKKQKKEIEDYNQIIKILTEQTEEITDYRVYISRLTNPMLRLEILKEIYQKNQMYYEKLEKRYKEQVEKSEAGYEALCQKYHLLNVNIEEVMSKYSYKELEGILVILTDMGIQDLEAAIKDTSLMIIKEIISLLEKKVISIDVIKSTPNIWSPKINYPKRIKENIQIIQTIIGSDELYKTRSQVTLIETATLEKNLNVLRKYNLLGQLHTTTNYQFLRQEALENKIDLILELGKEKELTHNLGLLNYKISRWQRLRILETLNIPVEEDMLEGILHTNQFLVPDKKIQEYLDILPLPKEISLNQKEVMETNRTYTYRGISFSKNKVRRNLIYLEKESPDYIKILTTGRKFTQKEIEIMKKSYTK